MTDVIPIPGSEPLRREQPALGYAMALAAAALFGVNGSVVKVALGEDMSAYRLAELRCLFSFAIFVLIVAVVRPDRLRVSGRELLYLAIFGACAVVLTQLLYVLALRRLKIGVALVLIFLGPLLVALWARFVGQEASRATLLGGARAVARRPRPRRAGVGPLLARRPRRRLRALRSSRVRVVRALRGACRRPARPDLAALLRLLLRLSFVDHRAAVVEPALARPRRRRVAAREPGGRQRARVGARRLDRPPRNGRSVHPRRGGLAAPAGDRVAICGMLEPVVATLVAFGWLDETLAPAQLAGGALVLAAIALAQTAR